MGEAELLQLVDGCRRQNRADQKMLYKAFYGFAMGICLRYTHNRYEASEIMNQGFLKVFTNLDKYDTNRPFKAWIGRIMMNTAIDHYRSNLKVAFMEDIDAAADIGHDDLPDRKMNYNDLLAMIQRLPNAYRTVFNLFVIDGYSHEEIAAMLNISTGTSKSNLFKAREKLKKMIAEAELTDGRSGSGTHDHFVSITAVLIGVPFLINIITQ
jgi:RNA polymerase sigma-70 factor (ECF subfamily)